MLLGLEMADEGLDGDSTSESSRSRARRCSDRLWVAMPFWPHLFQESQRAGKAIDAALQHNPRPPLYVIGDSTDHNMLVYVRGAIRGVTLDGLAQVETPAIAVMLPDEETALAQRNPRMRLIDRGNIVSMRTIYALNSGTKADFGGGLNQATSSHAQCKMLRALPRKHALYPESHK